MSRCIVLRGVRPQTRRVLIVPGQRSGVLVDGEPVTVFSNRRQAQRAIARTAAAVAALASAVVDIASRLRESPEFVSLFSGEPLSVVDVETLSATGVACELDQPRPSIDDDLDSPVPFVDALAADFWEERGIKSRELYPPGHSKA